MIDTERALALIKVLKIGIEQSELGMANLKTLEQVHQQGMAVFKQRLKEAEATGSAETISIRKHVVKSAEATYEIDQATEIASLFKLAIFLNEKANELVKVLSE